MSSVIRPELIAVCSSLSRTLDYYFAVLGVSLSSSGWDEWEGEGGRERGDGREGRVRGRERMRVRLERGNGCEGEEGKTGSDGRKIGIEGENNEGKGTQVKGRKHL